MRSKINFLSCGHLFGSMLTLLVLVVFPEQMMCMGQTNVNLPDQESFRNLPGGIIRKEIASFSVKGASMTEKDSAATPPLEAIRLRKCSDKFVSFKKGNIYDNELEVDISSEGQVPATRIKEIRLLFGRYGLMHLPDSAFADLCGPKYCGKYTKRGNPIASHCKVLRSGDKSRVYLYMRNGEGSGQYEVTWVVQDRKYHTRVVDRMP